MMLHEYLRQDKYRAVSKDYHRKLYQNNQFSTKNLVDLTVFQTQGGFTFVQYQKSILETFRMIALPLITEVEIVRNDTDYGVEYLFYLWRSDSPRIRAHTRRGTESNHPDHTRYILLT